MAAIPSEPVEIPVTVKLTIDIETADDAAIEVGYEAIQTEIADVEPDRDVDTRSDAYLEGAGLLPRSEGWAECAQVACSPRRQRSPLLDHYQRVNEELSDEVIDVRQQLDSLYDRIDKRTREAGKLHTAVRWLRDNTPQDDVSLRVIAHVLGEGDD